ncbi:MAG: hypothetical protein ABIO05_01455, partial [Ferruginibacter sp.]
MKKYISTTIFCTVLITATHAQPTDYYNSRAHQNAEYKTQSQATQRAFSVPDKPYSIPVYKSSTSSTSSNTNSSGSSSSNGGKINNNGGYINI